jgi:hypothetical protein
MYEVILIAAMVVCIATITWMWTKLQNGTKPLNDGWVLKRWEYKPRGSHTWANIEVYPSKDAAAFYWTVGGGLNFGTVKSGKAPSLNAAKSAASAYLSKGSK